MVRRKNREKHFSCSKPIKIPFREAPLYLKQVGESNLYAFFLLLKINTALGAGHICRQAWSRPAPAPGPGPQGGVNTGLPVEPCSIYSQEPVLARTREEAPSGPEAHSLQPANSTSTSER